MYNIRMNGVTCTIYFGHGKLALQNSNYRQWRDFLASAKPISAYPYRRSWNRYPEFKSGMMHAPYTYAHKHLNVTKHQLWTLTELSCVWQPHISIYTCIHSWHCPVFILYFFWHRLHGALTKYVNIYVSMTYDCSHYGHNNANTCHCVHTTNDNVTCGH